MIWIILIASAVLVLVFNYAAHKGEVKCASRSSMKSNCGEGK
jgi:hypothetical protein